MSEEKNPYILAFEEAALRDHMVLANRLWDHIHEDDLHKIKIGRLQTYIQRLEGLSEADHVTHRDQAISVFDAHAIDDGMVEKFKAVAKLCDVEYSSVLKNATEKYGGSIGEVMDRIKRHEDLQKKREEYMEEKENDERHMFQDAVYKQEIKTLREENTNLKILLGEKELFIDGMIKEARKRVTNE